MSLYTPTTPNAPLFKERNEFQGEASFFFNGLNFKTAYTPLRHFAIQINGQIAEAWAVNYHKYAEAAIGYYHCFKNNLTVECYGGYGKGDSRYSDAIFANETLLNLAEGHYEKCYLQLNIGNRCLWRNGGMGFCVRAANVRYSYSDANFRNLINTTLDHRSIEPYWFMHLNTNKQWAFKLYAGITAIQGLSNEPYQATMRTNVINIGTGFRVKLGGKGKKRIPERTSPSEF